MADRILIVGPDGRRSYVQSVHCTPDNLRMVYNLPGDLFLEATTPDGLSELIFADGSQKVRLVRIRRRAASGQALPDWWHASLQQVCRLSSVTGLPACIEAGSMANDLLSPHVTLSAAMPWRGKGKQGEAVMPMVWASRVNGTANGPAHDVPAMAGVHEAGLA